mgnify:CR=1 FL=1
MKEMIYKTLILDDRYKYILSGLLNTIVMAFFAVIIGIILGLIVSIIRNDYEVNKKHKILNFISKMYVEIIRGTPVILQLMIIYYVIFKSVNINIILVGIIAFGINSGAYVSEIIRSGIKSIDKGQMEAGLSLGLKYKQVMKLIVLPEAFKNILPSLGNEFITLLKETSVGAYIGIIELTKSGDIIASRTYDYFFPLIIVALVYLILTLSLSKMVIAIIYLIMTLGLSKLVNVMERRLNNVRS